MGARYFSGIKEELDHANEFYHDVQGGKLYWAPGNRSMLNQTLVAPVLEKLIVLAGSTAEAPVKNIQIKGLIMRHTAPTFCCDAPYEVPSGGDWSIHRGGTVMLENATGIEISDCLLDGPGGNGILLSNQIDGCEIHHNEIRFSGDSAIAALTRVIVLHGWQSSSPSGQLRDPS